MSNFEIVYLGLGSNEGDRRLLLLKAIDMLSDELGRPLRLSKMIETKPVGFSSPNLFLNMVAVFFTDVSPFELLNITEKVERRLGRTVKRHFIFGKKDEYFDRTIDIDILFYGDKIVSSERLIIPHPRLHKRPFVLLPLAEISPNFIHPKLGKSILELKKNLFN